MGAYQSEPGIDPVRIETFRRMRKRWKYGDLQDSNGLYADFFTDTARDPRRG
ncbi:hypothetical protein [uncultured Curtobacterium sp.]|uniref:hypothetical protein n=1 Tax=uncultured Curtobacterium sp. TaxID=331964 RepID=UPI002582CA5A|nr:hypothetical protein [uncultured Curtobacterium sp.]